MNKHLLDWILLYVVSVIILATGQFFFHQVAKAYYTYMPIETFYENVSFKADNACIGDSSHLLHSQRFVYGTDVGYGGEVVREMFLIKDGREVKVLEEHAMPFVEVRLDGLVTREQPLPKDLKEGEYQWIMYLTLLVHGVQRSDIPPIESNLFTIKKCV